MVMVNMHNNGKTIVSFSDACAANKKLHGYIYGSIQILNVDMDFVNYVPILKP